MGVPRNPPPTIPISHIGFVGQICVVGQNGTRTQPTPCTIVTPRNVPNMRYSSRMSDITIQKSHIVVPHGYAAVDGRIMPITWFNAPEGHGGPITLKFRDEPRVVELDEGLKTVVSMYLYYTSPPPGGSMSDEEDTDDDEDTP